MAAYRRVYDSRHLQADCHEPGSAPELYAGWSSMDYLYLFIPDSDFQQNMTSTDLSYWSRSLCISRENARRSVDVCVCVCVCVFGASRYFVCRRLCPSRRRRQTLTINHVAARHARDDRPANTADKFDSRILKSARFATAVVYIGWSDVT